VRGASRGGGGLIAGLLRGDDAVSAPASIDEFLARYPVDERAQNYLMSSPPMVVGRVLREFQPPRQGESDYSGLLTTYIKRLRQTQIVGNTGAGPSGGKASNGHHALDHQSLYPGKAPFSAGPLPVDTEFREFCKRYPIDEGAQSYLSSAPAEVMLRIIHEFRPPREGENDYSALLMTFAKKCRAEARDAGWQHGGGGSWGGNNVQACQAAPQPARPEGAAAIDAFARWYPIDERARDYFLCSAPEVQEKVLREFQAKSEGEPDYSGLFTAFVKRCRAACPVQHEQHRWPAHESQRWPGQDRQRWVAHEPSAMYPLGLRDAARSAKGGCGGGRAAAVVAAAAQHRPQSSASSSQTREDQLSAALDAFLQRYPMDERAFAYLSESSVEVQERVFVSFVPPREDDTDFSAPVTAYTKQLRKHLGHGTVGGYAAQTPEAHATAVAAGIWESAAPPHPGSGDIRQGASRAGEAVRDEQDEALAQFFARYPVDERALDYLATASPSVIDRVMTGFRPKQEGDSDYSALVMTFTKKCKDQEQWAAPYPYEPASKRLRT